ncbi:c-type cytochrome [Chelativorans salis]|uniref:Cytochrome c n=1 Tax=Chelativorans salis TaxID=2978478 RepID=A0ABT2LV90_9HYPH|nr:cytochrome c [Chelativorans sp. EGI FJ00035]MCT7378429.1 cytochrome c [Chelativorans sp. EGI FJ00035]
MPYLVSMLTARVPVVVLALFTFSTGAAGGADEAMLELGRQVFLTTAEPPCGVCHTLANAEATGTIAPNLDTMRPTAEEVRNALMEGPGAMPSYADTLSDEEIDAVAEHVAAVAGAE